MAGTDLLWGPLVMGMLCIFVGNVLKFFRKGDTRKWRQCLNIYYHTKVNSTILSKFNFVGKQSRRAHKMYYYWQEWVSVIKCWIQFSSTLQTTHLAVLMGLGSKLPCASTETCFSRVAPRLASTKSGGRAPAMAHRHDLAILKSSASYFYRGGKTQREAGLQTGVFSPFSPQWGHAWLAVRLTAWAEQSHGKKNGGRQHERQGAGGVCTKRWPVTNW